MPDPIRISSTDLSTPEVEQYVEMQQYLSRDVPTGSDQPWVIRVIYANWFYLSIAAMLGGLAGWALFEPWYTDTNEDLNSQLIAIFFFPAIASGVGLFLGAAEGMICRNPVRSLKSGLIGMGVGFLGGLLAIAPTSIVFGLMSEVAVSLMDKPQQGVMPTGIALLVLMMGRAAAWAIAGIPAGLGQGIALGEKKVIVNGVVGGLLGGLIGGLLFDPIYLALTADDGEATLSRAVGFATIGFSVGLFVGLIEGWTKTAWLLMRKGPLAGKQFIMFKDTTVLGSSPKADVYLFKDDAIEPQHALIVNRGGRFEIEDNDTPDGTYVNGIPIKRQVLHDGDQIVLGKTVLEFSVKERES